MTFYRYQIKLTDDAKRIYVHSEDPQGTTLRQLNAATDLPARMQALAADAARVRRGTAKQSDLEALGETLFAALFAPNAQQHLDEGYHKLAADQVLRIELDLDEAHAPHVAVLPWELLRSPEASGHPAINWGTDRKVVLSRRRPLDNPASPIALNEPLRIQLVVSTPQDKDLGPVEYETVLAALQELSRKHPKQIAPPLSILMDPTLTDLEKTLEANKPHAVHFIGHGRLQENSKKQAAALAFVGPGKTAQWIDDESIGDVLGKYQIAVVLLQACESGANAGGAAFVGVASQIVQQNVPVVIAMQYPISNATGATFAQEFYNCLAGFEPVDVAVQKSRRVLRQQDRTSREFAAPVLYMRVRDGQLFQAKDVDPSTSDGNENKLRFSAEWVEEAPHPLAAPLAAFNRASNDRERFMALDLLTHNLIKYLFAIALSQYRIDQYDTTTLRGYRAELTNTELASRLRVLDGIAAHYTAMPSPTFLRALLFHPYTSEAGEDSALDKALRLLRKLDPEGRPAEGTISPQSFLQHLVHYRETQWEGYTAGVSAELTSTLLRPWFEALQECLARLETLFTYPTLLVEDVAKLATEYIYTLYAFTGPEGIQRPLPAYHEPAKGNPTFKYPRLYLGAPDGTPLLGLQPFLIYSGGKLYFLERCGSAFQLDYRHCATSEPHHRSAASFFLSGNPSIGADNADAQDPNTEFDQENDLLDSEEELLRASEIPLPDLFAHLDSETLRALHIALGESLRIGEFWLGVEFLLMGLSKSEDGILSALLETIGMDPGEFRGMLRGLVEVRKRDWREVPDVEALGVEAFAEIQAPDSAALAEMYNTPKLPRAILTPRVLTILRQAYVSAKKEPVTEKHLLLALLTHPQSIAVNMWFAATHQGGMKPNELVEWIQAWGEPEEKSPDAALPEALPVNMPAGAPKPPVRRPQGKGLLGQFGRDLNVLAEAGELYPAVGDSARKAMLQIGLILQQTKANNPILLGDPGVGKTAIVEGLAWRLAVGAAHDQPVATALTNKRIVDLPPTALLAGTKYRGDLEERLQKILAEVRAAQGDTIVFIDEIHTILGGRAEGGLGAISDALKPALARGEFPCIGATTVGEYRRYIESDPALARRFTPVWIEEPSPAEAVVIAKDVARRVLEPQHRVRYPNNVIEEAVRLAVRYIHDEFLPGKAIKLLDQAGPRVMMGGTLAGVQVKNGEVVGDGQVSIETLREIVAERTGIPLTRLSETESARLLHLEDELRRRVKGQDEALRQVAQVVKKARTGLADPRRPLGVFLFAGPTGVGKTELALALAQALFDEEDAILRFDMSEFMEKHQVSRLIGSPPGYVGHEEEGQLTGRLRRRPYSVVLLDEMEKAHRDVQHMFLQLFDAGRLTDARGNVADGRNAIFVMTTNLGAKEAVGFINERQSYQKGVQAAIEEHFTPEFLNRVNRIIYFDPLNLETLLDIFDNLLARVQERLKAQGIGLSVTDEFKSEMCRRMLQDRTRGARPLERAIEDEIVAPLNDMLLAGEVKPGMRILWPQVIVSTPKEKRPMGSSAPPPREPPAASAPTENADAKDPSPPGMDPREAQNRQILDQLFEDWKRKWQGREIEFTLAPSAVELLCSPFWQDDRQGLATADAFAKLVQAPLEARITDGIFGVGDRVEISRDTNLKIVFQKQKGATQ